VNGGFASLPGTDLSLRSATFYYDRSAALRSRQYYSLRSNVFVPPFGGSGRSRVNGGKPMRRFAAGRLNRGIGRRT
jgi:hypothetical protein